jgi:ABC-type branched-subunit amino acid transport system permease subunit
MDIDLFTRTAALLAVLGTAVVYGTDVFCAMVLRPALAHVDDRALVAVTGYVHRFGDRRMPLPGVLGVVAAAASTSLAAISAHWPQTIAAGAALVLLLIWMALYLRVSAPINRQLTAAADAGQTIPNGRALQAQWDRIIGARATLQGLAVAALCLALVV